MQWIRSLPPLVLFGALAAGDETTKTARFDHPIGISKIRIKFNQGCEDLLKISILVNKLPLFDYAQDKTIYGDDEVIEIDGGWFYKEPPNEVAIWAKNTDTASHTLKVIVCVEEITG